MLQAKIPQLSTLVADVWVEERHRREMEVTQNPIEFGAPITDHAFVKPRSLSVTFGVTNTPLLAEDEEPPLVADRVEEMRLKLYELQDNKSFLVVNTITGGQYPNCLLTGIGWTTDVNNPHAVIFDLDLEEVIVTFTEQANYQPLPPEIKTKKKTEPTKKRGERPKKSLSSSKGRKRTGTRDASSSSKEQAKASAAQKQRRSIRK